MVMQASVLCRQRESVWVLESVLVLVIKKYMSLPGIEPGSPRICTVIPAVSGVVQSTTWCSSH